MSALTSRLAQALVLWAALAGTCAQAQPAADARSAAAQARFDILEYRVEGSSLLAAEAIERAVMPHLGEGRTLQDVENARAAVERRYHEAGYLTVLVQIPEQKVDEGVVTLKVVEAPVGRVRVAGSGYHLPSAIREQLQLAEGKVPNFNELQASLGEVNRSADMKVSPVLKPGRAPGTVDVQLDVEDQLPLHGGVELSNRQAPNTSAARLNANLRYDNLWQAGHSFGVGLQVTPQDTSQSRVATLNYMMPLGRGGDALSAYLVRSRSRFATLYNSPGLGLLGNSTIAGLRVSRPFVGAHGVAHTLSLGVDRKQIEQSLSVNGVGAPQPAVTYVPLSASWRSVWTGHQPQPTVLDVSLILGLRGLLGNSDQAFNAKRAGASASFLAARTGLQVYQSLGRWTASANLEAQAASGPLLPSEQFVAGGVNSVRGYLEAERTGDDAVRVSFELASPAWKHSPASAWLLRGIAFFDEAALRTRQAAAGQSASTSLAGLGLGLRASGPSGLSMQADLARALTDGDLGGGGTRAGSWRLHGRLNMEF